MADPLTKKQLTAGIIDVLNKHHCASMDVGRHRESEKLYFIFSSPHKVIPLDQEADLILDIGKHLGFRSHDASDFIMAVPREGYVPNYFQSCFIEIASLNSARANQLITDFVMKISKSNPSAFKQVAKK